MPKNKKTKVKENELIVLPASGSHRVKAEIDSWAEAGTEEGLKKLDAYIAAKDNIELRDYALLVHGEAQYHYYRPRNKKEWEDFELSRQMRRRQNYLMKLINKAEDIELSSQCTNLEGRVHESLMKKQNAAMKKAWQYRYFGDVMGGGGQLQEIKEDIAYESAWLKEAAAMMTTKRYENIPDDIFEHLQLTADGGAYWTDDLSFMDDEDDDDVHCPHCGSNEVEEIDDEEDFDDLHPVGDYREMDKNDLPF